MDDLFGNDDVSLQKLSDAAGVLRMKEREAIRKVLQGFEHRFPQLFVSIYVGAFDEIPSLRQFGFWLLNRSAYTDVGVDRPNENGILLVVDVNGKTASLTFGYALMPYLDEENTFEALSAAHPFLLQGEYLKSFKVIVQRIEGSLKKGWRRVKRDPESLLAASGQAPKRVDHILQRIREGNQEVEVEPKVEQEL
ncbi:MAG: TPM domain-containing protein [Verrucomicrobiaceae bacterium]